jgi:hypothetical protein
MSWYGAGHGPDVSLTTKIRDLLNMNEDFDPQTTSVLDFPILEGGLWRHAFSDHDVRRLARCDDLMQIRFRNSQIAWLYI